MRIIAGEFGGRVLRSKTLPELRPTSDRVRESLFGYLEARGLFEQDRLPYVLDLYAGLGSLGIEALSRGAVHATFVEIRKATSELLRQNLQELGVAPGRYDVMQMEVERYLAMSPDSFDLVFADPPYHLVSSEVLLSQIACSSVMSEETLFVYEVPGSADIKESVAGSGGRPGLELLKQKKYGDTVVLVYQLVRPPVRVD
ncbi:MAG: 16S rRNA (guanine(966)-N(2))-methyltransferase RsmD [bacterium]|nr:16S rRNA (guanine(966)-N(2))-methyltransferase RsmD [bacterium]